MSEARDQLYQLVRRWEDEARGDSRDNYPYQTLLDELLFHSDLRFKDYLQFQSEGEFPVRLKKWLDNFADDRQKKILFKLLRWITFIDKAQMLSLHRDVYRRIIVPWLCNNNFSAIELLNRDYKVEVSKLFRKYLLLSITESLGFPDFIHINDLIGLPKPIILGEHKKKVGAILSDLSPSIKGIVILEDFVGTGKQAAGVIAEVRRVVSPEWRILFAPLIALESGLMNLKKKLAPLQITTSPALVIPQSSCFSEQPRDAEPPEFTHIRTLIRRSARRVLEPLDANDDPPTNAFGYMSSGALIITYHNAPNNTIPLIHHRAPNWDPLFRRVHHSKDYL